jgi:ComF family protein
LYRPPFTLCAWQAYTRRTMPGVLERASRVALDLLFPPQCAICRAGGSVLCEYCIATLPLADAPRCVRCWDGVKHGSLCVRCATAPTAFESVRAPYAHEDGARELVHELKYGNLTSLAEPMAREMAPMAAAFAPDVMVPVPLHGGRERSRGYNQSALLAKAIGRETGIAVDAKAARRVRATKPLVQAMSPEERAAIVDGAFRAEGARVGGRRVLLVDDVVTTGATLGACARAVLDAGATSVVAVTFVRA